jgi:hypothetical protein
LKREDYMPSSESTFLRTKNRKALMIGWGRWLAS